MARDGPQGGFTLLELMFCTAIVALLFVSGSGLYGLVERERNFRTLLELRRLLNFSRAEAVNRQTPVTLCALGPGLRCQRRWTGHEIAAFIDHNRNFRLDSGEAIRRHFWPTERGQLEWRAALGRPYLVYRPGGDTAQNGSFRLCYANGAGLADVVLVVNRGGRSYVDERRRRRCS